MNDFELAFQRSMNAELAKFAATAKVKPAQPTNETIKGETPEQRQKRILREGSEEGLLNGKTAQAKNCGGKGQPTCETVKGETQEQRTKRILREGSEEGLMGDKKSSGAESLYAQYREAMYQQYGR